jgi:hypothetical protein
LLYSLPMKDEIIFIVYLRWGHVARSCLSALFDLFELYNNWLCTSSDVDARCNYPLTKKMSGLAFGWS